MIALNKLNNEDSIELYQLLKELKKNNWIVDRRDLSLFVKIIDFHLKITGLISAYDGYDSMEQISCMTRDLIQYFKQPINIIPKQKCSKCRKSFPVEEFLSNKKCYSCRKNIKL